MPTLFRKCPSCGKRFEVKHTGETVEKKTEVVTEERTVSAPSVMAANSLTLPLNPSVNPQTVRVAESIEEDDYTEAYKCKHCGYSWTEKHEEVEDLGEVKGAGVDR
jgi:transposase-like protein